MGRLKKKGHSGERWVGIPLWIVKSNAYRKCSHTARSLLIDIAAQYHGRNNGLLVACETYLRPLGWTSNDTVTRAKAQLLECGLLIETRKGRRPNKAAWYALGWRQLDAVEGIDIDPRAYRTISQREIDALTPSPGAKRRGIAPSLGVEGYSPTPGDGAIRAVSQGAPTPGDGDYIKKPCPVLKLSGSTVSQTCSEAAPCP